MKGEDGKPKTKPRNIYSGLNRTGVSKKDYMQVPESIYAKDEYVDTYKRELQYFNKTHSRSVMHETDFVPASGNKTLYLLVDAAAHPASTTSNKKRRVRRAKEDLMEEWPLSQRKLPQIQHPRCNLVT